MATVNGDGLVTQFVLRHQTDMADTSAMSDEELVRHIIKGEKALFETLMRRNNQRLYRSIRSVVADEAAAEEAMQQTYVLAFQRLGQFAGGSSFSTWLVRIGLNEGLQHLRRTRKWSGSEAMVEANSSAANPEQRTYARETMRLLEQLLDGMPPMYRLAIMLREVEGLSTAEVADAMSVSEDTVKQRVFRGRELMRAGLETLTGDAIRDVFSFEAKRCDRVVAAVFAQL